MSAAPRARPDSVRVRVTGLGTRAPVSAAALERAVRHVLRAERVASAEVSLTLLSRAAMARMNRTHLQHAGATDVISFGFAPTPGAGVVGDIYVCPDVARENASRARCGVREELLRLAVHGTLHVLGWDHPVDATREQSPMWRRQERLLASARRAIVGR